MLDNNSSFQVYQLKLNWIKHFLDTLQTTLRLIYLDLTCPILTCPELTFLTALRPLSDSPKIPSRHPSDTIQSPSRHLSSTFQTHSRQLSDWSVLTWSVRLDLSHLVLLNSSQTPLKLPQVTSPDFGHHIDIIQTPFSHHPDNYTLLNCKEGRKKLIIYDYGDLWYWINWLGKAYKILSS